MAARRKRRLESMLFDYESTSRTDFRDGSIESTPKTVYKEKSSCLRVRPGPLKDIHALTDWFSPTVPFNLMHKPKEIVQTNPKDVQKPYSEPEDLFRKEAQRTRPRLVMTPAVSMDDIESDEVRDMLVEDVYTTNLMKANRQSAAKARSVCAPLPEHPAPANPLTLNKLKPPYVSPEWRMDSAGWDIRQLRTYCNPTREFWLKKRTICDACEETAAREARAKMMRQAKRQ